MEAALKDFAAADRGFAQYAQRSEDISRDDKIKLQYAIWTEGMSAIEQAEVEGRAKERKDMTDALLSFGVSSEILEKVCVKLAETRTNLR